MKMGWREVDGWMATETVFRGCRWMNDTKGTAVLRMMD